MRLGRNGAEEIKQHPFFEGFDWDGVRSQIAPYQPSVTSEISNENFDHFDEEEPFYTGEDQGKRKAGNRKLDMNFIGYTYKADVEEQRSMLVNVLKDLGNIADGQISEAEMQLYGDQPQHSQQHLSHQQQQQY